MRAAVMEANALPGKTDIILASGTYTLTLAGAGESWAATGDLDIADTTDIRVQAELGVVVVAGRHRTAT